MATKDNKDNKDNTQVDNTAGVAPFTPQWPLDQYGFTSALRKALVTAIGRVNGDDQKYTLLIETLREAGRFAAGRLDVQKAVREAAVARVADAAYGDDFAASGSPVKSQG